MWMQWTIAPYPRHRIDRRQLDLGTQHGIDMHKGESWRSSNSCQSSAFKDLETANYVNDLAREDLISFWKQHWIGTDLLLEVLCEKTEF